MKALLTRIAEYDGNHPSLLIDLFNELRPPCASNTEQASRNVLALCHLIEQSTVHGDGLRNYLLRVVGNRKQSDLYSDVGIFDGTGFFTELSQRMRWKVLPPAVNKSHFKDIFIDVFHKADDWIWVSAIDDGLWQHLIETLRLQESCDSPVSRRPLHEILDGIITLSHRLTALGLDTHLVRVHPAIEAYDSPFIALNAEISAYVQHYHEFLQGSLGVRQDERQALVLITQCRDMLRRIRKRAPKTGISIRLTQLIVRMLQTIKRMETLLSFLENSGERRHRIAVRLFKDLVRASNRRFSLRDVISTHTSLLALRVTENAGRTGEHYVTTTRQGYFRMLRSAQGAGFIVAFMAVLKVLAGKLSLAPIGAAILLSMNYSLGFMLIHMLRFTIATKQPAMTAARIAASIQEAGCNREKSLDGLAELCVNVFRSQFIAIMGNVMLAFPLSILLALLWQGSTGEPLASPEKVRSLLHDIDPVHSLALFYAAIAGVCLFVSGLISGYYDNKAVYSRIPERLRQRRSLQKLLGRKRLYRLSIYVEKNLGALAGNFYFGIMLGSMGTIGFILGLPLDIRHITFSAAYFSFSLVGSGFDLPMHTMVLATAGVMAIGMTNLLVSFSLALMVALKARRVNYRQWLPLLGMVARRFAEDPLRFFWPPKGDRTVSTTFVELEEKKAA
ncbi:MAG: site-specific recombinase Gcr [Moraxellaceae bacterium]|nr:site-specific recombinase Gcr [Moraxellaceae bacterium]